jgi:hypothetical protein
MASAAGFVAFAPGGWQARPPRAIGGPWCARRLAPCGLGRMGGRLWRLGRLLVPGDAVLASRHRCRMLAQRLATFEDMFARNGTAKLSIRFWDYLGARLAVPGAAISRRLPS